MGKKLDITGERYGKLVALYPVYSDKGQWVWMFQCDCGKQKEIKTNSVRVGSVKSCGCTFRKHGETKTRLYNIWVDMRQRCKKDGKPEHDNWGNRGITVCDEWNDYITFRDWSLQNGYSDELTIDRIDNNKGYYPGNCRWATYSEQAKNTRKSRLIEMDGESHTVKDWCEKLQIVSPCTAYRRVRQYGWSYEKALTTPATPRKQRYQLGKNNGK